MGKPKYGRLHGNTPIAVGTCTESGKRQYATRKDAKSCLKATLREFGEKASLWSPYPCEACYHWHIGHTPYRKR